MSMTNEEASNILRLLAAESLEGVSRFVESENNRDMFKQAYEMAIKSLEESVAVVRCKDCSHTNARSKDGECWHCVVFNLWMGKDFFCKNGERRSE